MEERVSLLERDRSPFSIRLKRLNRYQLREPLDVIVEFEEDGYIARAVDLDRYGLGDDPFEAVADLKNEVEQFYDELLSQGKMTDNLKRVKIFLDSIIAK
ncbi:MAG: hypothetical protein AB1896_02110 [Thermodesulfobacteriota bacterium]